ncbi:prolyl oligopeptidase family serine peptidase [Corallococcus sp. BB11-1]|uniref:S9 family peptidase n=1 Tax=Corallococcus sp. BB11-1 TaxID=2996783 RepID=UPI00226FE9A1|nr:prolyl oligopeptidase family serine peptidase [Corallococcus sp. BB11-1]MCY1034354.1 prolyl oligopeptidase family serine peptidase [Corallococcus sp. BB11-1]
MLALTLLADRGVAAEEAGYRRPSPEVEAWALRPDAPFVDLEPRQRWVLLREPPGPGTATSLPKEMLRVAGLYFFSNRAHATGSPFTAMSLVRLADGHRVTVTGLPASPWLQDPRWSPDGRTLAFTHATPERVEPWVLDVDTGKARRLAPVALHGVAGPPCEWAGDSRELVCRLAPEGPVMPEPHAAAPLGPYIQERAAPGPDHGETQAPVGHVLEARLARIRLEGQVSALGRSGAIVRAEPSPDGAWLLVESLQAPFPSSLSEERLARRIEVWTRDGQPVRTVADLPVDTRPVSARKAPRPGPREVRWLPGTTATLLWVEAAGTSASPSARDDFLTLAAPFTGTPAKEPGGPQRFVSWVRDGTDCGPIAEVSREDGGHLWRSWEPPGAPGKVPVPRALRAGEGESLLPGPAARGKACASRTFFVEGTLTTPEGPRAFVDAVDGAGGRTRLWRASGPVHEIPVAVLDGRRLLFLRESPTAPPDLFLQGPRKAAARALTRTAAPAALQRIRSEVLRYTREDGLALKARLTVPRSWRPEQGALPTLLWAYPFDHPDARAMLRDAQGDHRFPDDGPLSPRVWAARGFAVLEPEMPVVATAGQLPNDTAVPQLIADARAAVDLLVRRKIADPARIAVGGHSYGAAMAVTLLARTDLFRAGIALSGAYNRTLTPFGFQGEQRTLWEAPGVYQDASAFLVADRIRAPLLLIHGQRDMNPATPFFQSEALYRALERRQVPARLVGLPGENHVLQGRDAILHALWEMEAWLGRHVAPQAARDGR